MDQLQTLPMTLCLGKVALAAGTTTTLSNTGTITYAIRSKALSRAALSNTATPTLDVNTGLAFAPVLPNKGSVFVIGLNAAGTLQVAQGTIESLDASGAFIYAPQFPATPNDFCPIAYEVIRAGSTASASGWIFGTSNQSAVTGITYTFVDVVNIPDRPQVS